MLLATVFCERLMRLSHAQFAWPNIFPVYLKSWVLEKHGLAIKAHRKASIFVSVYCLSDMQRTAESIAYRVFNSSAATLQERHALLWVQAGMIILSLTVWDFWRAWYFERLLSFIKACFLRLNIIAFTNKIRISFARSVWLISRRICSFCGFTLPSSMTN